MTSMAQSAAPSQNNSCREEVVLGVDTHKDTHVASVITILGVLVATAAFPTTAAATASCWAWASSLGLVNRAGVEGTGSYGAGLARYLRRQHITVVEVNRSTGRPAAGTAKSDTVDATAAAHAVLSARATGTAKTGDGPVEMLRMFHLARASAVKSRTQAINQLKAVIIGADPALRDTLTGLSRTDHPLRPTAALSAVQVHQGGAGGRDQFLELFVSLLGTLVDPLEVSESRPAGRSVRDHLGHPVDPGRQPCSGRDHR
jgi:hypothetical protein